MNVLSRKSHLAEKIVFIDGLPGCGKTLFSKIVSSMDRVELLSYTYEIEHFCALHSLDRMPIDASINMIRMHTDLKLYNTMMARDVNFRPTDLSSALKNHDAAKYFKRALSPGDEIIPEKIKAERPILNFSTHNLLGYSKPIWEALGDRCVFIEIVRHPLYMVRQQALNMENLVESVRDFTVYFKYKECEIPYYAFGWEEKYLKSNPIEKVVYFINELTCKIKKNKKEYISDNSAKILTVPFEPFVLHPDTLLKKISIEIGSKVTSATEQIMLEQKIPRNMVADGIDLEIYRRCGWEPPKDYSSERDELNIRREDVAREVSSDVLAILDRLSEEYEEQYWNPDSGVE